MQTERQKELSKATYEYAKTKGICVRCHKEPALINSTYCFECTEKRSEYDRKRYSLKCEEIKANKIKYRKDIIQKRASEGICTKCGKHRPEEGYRTCGICRAAAKEKYKASVNRSISVFEIRDMQGTCRVCGKGKRIEGKKVCGPCYERIVLNWNKVMDKVHKSSKYWTKDNRIIFRKSAVAVNS